MATAVSPTQGRQEGAHESPRCKSARRKDCTEHGGGSVIGNEQDQEAVSGCRPVKVRERILGGLVALLIHS